MKTAFRQLSITALALFILMPLLALTAQAGDQKPEDIVAKHLDSIGTPQARTAAVSRVVQGKADFKVLVGGAGNLEGKSVLVSQGKKVQLMMKFADNDYRGEQFIFDGDKTQVTGTTSKHTRSTLGEFVYVQNAILKEGLLGGVLSTAWPLQDLGDRKAKLNYEGLKKVDGQELLDLRYKPKKNSDLDIHLYFDPTTYHHVMTVYTTSIRAGLANIDAQLSSAVPTGSGVGTAKADAAAPIATGGVVTETSETATAHQQETRYRLEEKFTDFQTVNGLTLPTHYRIEFSQELKNGQTSLNEWDMDFPEVVSGTGVDPRNFEVK
jgi:hypothetical protein